MTLLPISIIRIKHVTDVTEIEVDEFLILLLGF
jgi:hypothetical protein